MADEQEEIQKVAKAVRDLADASEQRYLKEIAQAEAIRKLYKERLGLEGDLKEVIAQNSKIFELEARAAQARLEQSIRFRLEYQEKLMKMLQKEKELEKELFEENVEYLSALAEGREQETRAANKRVKQLEAEKKKVVTAIAAHKKLNQEYKQTEEQDKKNFDAKRRLADADKKTQSSLRGVVKTMTGLTGETQTAIGAFAQLTGPQQQKILGQLGGVLKTSFSPLLVTENLLLKIVESTLHFMKEFDKLAADFRKNTGIIDKGFGGIEQRIVNVQRANLRMGVSMDEAFGAEGALVSGMAQFTSMTDEAQAQVLQATVIMQEFGVSASTTADIFNTFSKGLGFNSQQLEKLSTQLMGISTSLKIPPQIIATEFNAASKELMKYGGDMVNVFKGIAEQSKQTGIAMGELLGIVKQFDTFEGAGAAVGKLNAILGGPYLNAINMLYATEEDRVKMLRESVALSGKQFNQLSRFEQQAIATAAGISDMSVAARLFGGTNSEFAKTQMSMKEMQERAAKAQAVQEKFTQVMQSFAIALGPVVHLLGDLADILIIVLNPFTELFNMQGGLATALNGLFVLLIPLTLAFKGLGGAVMFVGAQLAITFGAFYASFKLIETFIDGLSGSTKLLTSIAAAILGIGAAFMITSAILSGGLSLPLLIGAAAAAGVAAAGLKGLASFSTGKNKGQSVGGGAALVGEKGAEMVVTEDGSRYMVNSPSVMALDKNDTVYTNAETKAMLNGGGGNSAALAQMRASQEQFMQSMREERSMLQKSISEMASRPLVTKLDGKTIYKNQKEYLQKDPSLRIV